MPRNETSAPLQRLGASHSKRWPEVVGTAVEILHGACVSSNRASPPEYSKNVLVTVTLVLGPRMYRPALLLMITYVLGPVVAVSPTPKRMTLQPVELQDSSLPPACLILASPSWSENAAGPPPVCPPSFCAPLALQPFGSSIFCGIG